MRAWTILAMPAWTGPVVALAAAITAMTATPAAAAEPAQTAWTVATAPVAGDIRTCGAKAERAFAAMGFQTKPTDHSAIGAGAEYVVLAKHPSRPMRFTAYCRPGHSLVVTGGYVGSRAELEAARDRFKAELAAPQTRSPAPVPAPASTIVYPSGISSEMKFFGSVAQCLSEGRAMLVQSGYEYSGELDRRLVVGVTPDRRFFTVIDCATTARGRQDWPTMKLRLAVTAGVAPQVRDAEASRLGGLMVSSPAEKARAEAARQQWDANQSRLQAAQAEAVRRQVQAEADAAAYGSAGGPYGAGVDERRVARDAATAIQAQRAYGSSNGAIIMENVPPPPPEGPGPYVAPPTPSAPPPPESPSTCSGHGCVTPY